MTERNSRYLVTLQTITQHGANQHPETKAHEYVKTFPKAMRVMSDYVYDMLEAEGLRDRPIAYRHMRTVSRLTRDVHSMELRIDYPGFGYSRVATFRQIGA